MLRRLRSRIRSLSPRAQTLLAILSLLAVNFLIYGQTFDFGFLPLDDPYYVVENSFVTNGLNGAGLRWAFTTFEQANWHPLTWLSLMVDGQLYGGRAGGYHLTNLLLHQANCLLLFVWLRGLVKAAGAGPGEFCWPAALAALGFAAHPLHVESVAWVTERKDVLSAFFLLLSLCAYTRYAKASERSTPGGSHDENWWRRERVTFYLLTWGSLALGLLAKPMLVTAPFLLLLLDGWPLRRWGRPGALLLEKIPFFLLVAACCVVTVVAQHRGGAVAPLEHLPVWPRLLNAVVAYIGYLGKTAWPTGLSVFYPYPTDRSWWQPVGAAALLTGITAAGWWQRRSRPYLLVGWFWFLGTLVPVIGIVQVGGQALADRYAYVPHIGICLALGCLGHDLARRRPAWQPLVISTAAAVVLAFAWTARAQTQLWQDNVVLFRHCLAVTQSHPMLNKLLGAAYTEVGNSKAAAACYREVLRKQPDDATSLNQLGYLELQQGHWAEATGLLIRAVALKPDDFRSWNNLGFVLARTGQEERALAAYRRCLQLRPGYPLAHFNLGELLKRRGLIGEATAHFERALALRPGWTAAAEAVASVQDAPAATSPAGADEARFSPGS